MRGVILAGGYGTRMAPATAVTNKHLLPVYGFGQAIPMIYFPVRTLVSSGIEHILIISSRQHSGQIIEHLGDGSKFGADFSYKVQDMDEGTPGIASALKIARDYTGKEKFAVILGDNYYQASFPREFIDFEKNLAVQSCIFLKEVDNPSGFGVVEWDDDGINCIYEKPKNPPSNFAVTGLYLFSPRVYQYVDDLKPSERGELEIIDLINQSNWENECNYHILQSFWSDLGTPESIRNMQEFISGSASYKSTGS